MFSLSVKEKRSFFYFLFLVLVTAFSFSQNIFSEIYFSILAMLWGIFGFYRYIYLSDTAHKNLPHILTLPSRILFGFNQQQDKIINLTMERFLKWDFLLSILLVMVFMAWGIYCSLHPAEIFLIENFWEGKKDVLQQSQTIGGQGYFILSSFSHISLMCLMVFVGVSYAVHASLLRLTQFIFLPLIVLLGGFITFFVPLSSMASYFDFSHIRGLGWGQFLVFETLAEEGLQNSSSGFLKRYVEMGVIGAYGLYVLFLPMFFTLVRQAFAVPLQILRFVPFIILMLLFALDFVWVWHPLMQVLQVISIAYLACIWGRAASSSINP